MIWRRQEKQKNTELNISKKKGDLQFTEGCRDHSRPGVASQDKPSDNKVNGPEDAIVSENDEAVALGKKYTIAKCFQERFIDGGSKFVEDCEVGLLEKTRCCLPKNGSGATRPLRSHLYFRSGTRLEFFFAWSKRGYQTVGRNYTCGGSNGISCQHLQVVAGNFQLALATDSWTAGSGTCSRKCSCIRVGGIAKFRVR